MAESRKPAVIRTYGTKPRKASITHLWDGSRDVPRSQPLSENTTELNKRNNTGGLGGFMKGVVDWLSPKKQRQTTSRKVSGKENKLSNRRERFSLSEDDDGQVSVASTEDTLIASTPKKEEKLTPEPKKGVDLLLQLCSKDEVVGFSEYIDGLLENAKVKKLGEATYSEVFTVKHNNGTISVLKVVPFLEDNEKKDNSMSNLQDILQEIRISRVMANVEGFADFRGATLVKGAYPQHLLTAWDDYATEKESENYRPSKFSETQIFCIIELSHHGQDLEAYTVSTWAEAAHIFWSVVRTLARGEQECEFEHRDLHWGNILIDKSGEDEILERLLDNLNLEEGGKELLDGEWNGVKVTLIDYTLSRAKVNDLVGQVSHYGFEDETLFEGKRDYQFDIYRQMRAIVSDESGAAWAEYRPATNVLWLHYLANKLLYAKQLPTPVTRLSARNQSKLAGSRTRGHERSFSVILEGEDKEAYEGLLNVYNKINPKNSNSVENATEVLEMGRDNGWAL